jgi:catechol 2,3-dioxygenase-like lactoylglutathione lyase family enzyme
VFAFRKLRLCRLVRVRFGYTILYVRDVAASLEFYERAFGQTRRLLHESGQYAELETGATTLAFASRELAASNLPEGASADARDEPPTVFEVCFVSDDVEADHTRAVEAGARTVSEPQVKPWGQHVAYVRDLEGNLIELASPVT